MRRVLVLGSPGSGKSTFARRLADRLGAPLIHLDFYFWCAGWEPVDETTFRSRVSELVAMPEWVMDGNYSRTFDIRMPRADTAVWLECSRLTCLLRVTWRVLREYGHVRPELPPGCPEHLDLAFLRYIWDFPTKHRPRIVGAVEQFGKDVRVVRLGGPRAQEDFLAAAGAC